MSKYSYEFKLKVVKAYLKSHRGIRVNALQYDVPAKSLLGWVARFEAHGPEALKKSFTHHTTTFKLLVLEHMGTHQLSIAQTATHFNIPSPSTIGVWLRLYNQGGVTALEPKPKGRPPMPKQINYKALLRKPVGELTREELLQRLEYAEVENAYLKKLEALAQQKSLANKNKPK
jgi:transposase-like protein